MLHAQALLAVEAQEYAYRQRKLTDQYMADDADCPDVLRLAALGEELGEVCRAVHDGDQAALARELTQLAGVALAWGVALARVPT